MQIGYKEFKQHRNAANSQRTQDQETLNVVHSRELQASGFIVALRRPSNVCGRRIDRGSMKGKYKIGIEHIRSLAVICHVLDTGFDNLFNVQTIFEKSEAFCESYDRLLATNLLNLAISIRVSLSDHPEYRSTTSGIQACGLFEVGSPNQDGSFSIKDVCDKIIHADDIFKPMEAGVRGASCRLRGKYKRKPWEFGLGISIFCEIVLNWLDRIESAAKGT